MVYKKELNKVRKSEMSGAGEEDMCKPSLWYFNLLDFLNDQDVPRTPQETMDNDQEHVSIASTSEEHSRSTSQTSSASTKRLQISSVKKQSRSTDDELLNFLSKADQKLESISSNDSFDQCVFHIMIFQIVYDKLNQTR
ncbi:hypothetical protein LSTR_LSTR009882 [Laodelphax striatellus]|uniref:MADF domain-containing protein n=1 Tax=Laodelphax striatellus TaxID=195883 RepID=A0A482WK68_LAOST|nr:hypothetical protein LSTR_LSTR009882 [Laodelphax striatellus]